MKRQEKELEVIFRGDVVCFKHYRTEHDGMASLEQEVLKRGRLSCPGGFRPLLLLNCLCAGRLTLIKYCWVERQGLAALGR